MFPGRYSEIFGLGERLGCILNLGHSFDAIDALCFGRTSISVAHRLSTVVNADLIALVQGGRVIGSGTHELLLRDCAEYANLVRRQLRAADSSASLAS